MDEIIRTVKIVLDDDCGWDGHIWARIKVHVRDARFDAYPAIEVETLVSVADAPAHSELQRRARDQSVRALREAVRLLERETLPT